ncbi:unnamed protein product [Orchesella dallaii]|uniref:Zinc finger protein n=1 Tax=Orchesella dallaii TaxID=48710 RepID=A0ABP1PST9_9HEXA
MDPLAAIDAEEELECSICFGALPQICSITKCGHMFHLSCSRDWWLTESNVHMKDYHSCARCTQVISCYEKAIIIKDQRALKLAERRAENAELEVAQQTEKVDALENQIVELEVLRKTAEYNLTNRLKEIEERLKQTEIQKFNEQEKMFEYETMKNRMDEQLKILQEELYKRNENLKTLEVKLNDSNLQVEELNGKNVTLMKQVTELETKLQQAESSALLNDKKVEEFHSKLKSTQFDLRLTQQEVEDTKQQLCEANKHVGTTKSYLIEIEEFKKKLKTSEENQAELIKALECRLNEALLHKTKVETELHLTIQKLHSQENETISAIKDGNVYKLRCSELFKTLHSSVSNMDDENLMQGAKSTATKETATNESEGSLLSTYPKTVLQGKGTRATVKLVTPISEIEDKHKANHLMSKPKKRVQSYSKSGERSPKATPKRCSKTQNGPQRGTFVCHICGKSFALSSSKTQHLQTHTSTFECVKCGITFKYRTSLTKHNRKKHSLIT